MPKNKALLSREGEKRKQLWGKLYAHLPKKVLDKILLRKPYYERIGPIELPLEMSDHKTIERFTLYYFGFYESNQSYFLLTKNSRLRFTYPLVRISSNCNWAFDLDSKRCECRWQFGYAKERIAKEPRGDGLIIFALDQHGKSIPGGTRGHALIYALGQAQNQDLVHDAYVENRFRLDYRKYDDVFTILKDIGVKRMRLLTNNPERVSVFQEHGFNVRREHIEKDYDPHDCEELGVKKEVLGHYLNIPSFEHHHIKMYNLNPKKVFRKRD